MCAGWAWKRSCTGRVGVVVEVDGRGSEGRSVSCYVEMEIVLLYCGAVANDSRVQSRGYLQPP